MRQRANEIFSNLFANPRSRYCSLHLCYADMSRVSGLVLAIVISNWSFNLFDLGWTSVTAAVVSLYLISKEAVDKITQSFARLEVTFLNFQCPVQIKSK